MGATGFGHGPLGSMVTLGGGDIGKMPGWLRGVAIPASEEESRVGAPVDLLAPFRGVGYWEAGRG